MNRKIPITEEEQAKLGEKERKSWQDLWRLNPRPCAYFLSLLLRAESTSSTGFQQALRPGRGSRRRRFTSWNRGRRTSDCLQLFFPPVQIDVENRLRKYKKISSKQTRLRFVTLFFNRVQALQPEKFGLKINTHQLTCFVWFSLSKILYWNNHSFVCCSKNDICFVLLLRGLSICFSNTS